MWHPNGGELFYQRLRDSRLMSVPVVTSPSFDFEPAEELFDASPYIGGGRSYDIARDGRFLMVKEGEERPASAIVIQNWFEELKRLVPVR